MNESKKPTNINFSACAWCQICCHGTPLQDLDIQLTKREAESGLFPEFKDQTAFACGACVNLTEDGCSLVSDQRPFVCRAFPLMFYKGHVGIYQACPEAPGYLLGLLNANGPAANHYAAIKSEYDKLLASNDPMLKLMDEEIEEWFPAAFVALIPVAGKS